MCVCIGSDRSATVAAAANGWCYRASSRKPYSSGQASMSSSASIFAALASRRLRLGEPELLRTGLGWPADRPIVLFVGRLSIEKGVLDLLEAWRLVDRRGALLVLVGPDMPAHPWDAGRKARALVARHGLEDCVRFEGPAPETAHLFRA